MTSDGKTVRLARIIPGVRTVMVPFDDDLINGPYAGLADPVTRAREVALGGADAVLGFPRLLTQYAGRGVRLPFVANLTASTVLGLHTRKVAVSSVERAVRQGCDGVAVHVNVSDHHEPDMLATLGAVAEDCERWGCRSWPSCIHGALITGLMTTTLNSKRAIATAMRILCGTASVLRWSSARTW